jgi:hypothetical protein
MAVESKEPATIKADTLAITKEIEELRRKHM